MHGRLKLAVEAWNRRTPAPEGEAWRHVSQEEMAQAAKFASTNLASPVVPKTADEIKAVVMAWLDADDPASWGDFEKRLNAAVSDEASPVVPVEVRWRVLDELDKAWLHGQRRTSWRRDESADAIIAALRPTDTGWRDIATAPKDGSDILILASGMAIEARYAPGAWGPDVPGEVQEYDGPVWVAFDDLTQFEIEESVLEGGQDHHGAVTHWMPLPPAPTDTGRKA
jgi:hypothetical protein